MTANSRISSARNAVGTEVVLRAIPDGYTLLMVDASPSINVTLYERLNFNFPIALVGRDPGSDHRERPTPSLGPKRD